MVNPTAVLVPLDGSPVAEEALPLAALLAEQWKATLRAVMVHLPAQYQILSDPAAGTGLYDPELERQQREREQTYLRQTVASLNVSNGLRIETQLLDGAVGEALKDCVRTTGTGLVVMSSHGRAGVGRFFLGSVTDELVRGLDIPVLVFPAARNCFRAIPRRRRILLPLDGSQMSESVMGHARVLAGALEADLLLAVILQPLGILLPPFFWPTNSSADSPEAREPQVREYLESWQRRLRNEGFATEFRIRTASKIAPEILKLARDEECTLIAMATHGLGGLDRAMLGSVTDQVLRHSDLPVLSIRPAAVAAPRVPPDAPARELAATGG